MSLSSSALKCPNCKSEAVAVGHCMDQLGLGFSAVFRLQERRFLDWRNPVVSIPKRLNACVDCGMLWTTLKVKKLQKVVSRSGSSKLKERLANCERIPHD